MAAGFFGYLATVAHPKTQRIFSSLSPHVSIFYDPPDDRFPFITFNDDVMEAVRGAFIGENNETQKNYFNRGCWPPWVLSS